MNNARGFKQKLAAVTQLWDKHDYGTALAQVETMRETWPGNPQLLILWAQLVQLQDTPTHELDEAKQALQQALQQASDFDKKSPAALLELGYFLDNVEDDSHGAAKAFADAATTARQLLLDALIGQAKALRQLEKRDEFQRCLLEILRLCH